MKACSHHNNHQDDKDKSNSDKENFKLNDIHNKMLNSSDQAALEKELAKIDEIYDRDIEDLSLIEEQNLEALHSLNLDNTSQELVDTSYKKENKKLKCLDSQLIIDSIPELKTIEDQDKKIEALLVTKMFILCNKKIGKIENMQIFQNLEELYLQRNFIKSIENLHHCVNLQVLSLNNNYIRKVENVSALVNLQILDLSDNLITVFDVNELPESLIYLYLFDNLFYDNTDIYKFRADCISRLPKVRRIDCLDISDGERLILEGGFDINTTNLSIKKRLKFIDDHYKAMKASRRSVLNEFKSSLSDISIEVNVVDKDRDKGAFITTLSKIKQTSNDRISIFERASDDRMKDLRSKLKGVKDKFQDHASNFENEGIDRIKQKIRNSINYDCKIEELDKKIEDSERYTEEDSEISNQNLIQKYFPQAGSKQPDDDLDI